jgi:tryptophan-rich sensory protein
MPTAAKTRWFALCLFALAYVLTAAVSVILSHQRGARCGSADCMLLLKMTQNLASR